MRLIESRAVANACLRIRRKIASFRASCAPARHASPDQIEQSRHAFFTMKLSDSILQESPGASVHSGARCWQQGLGEQTEQRIQQFASSRVGEFGSECDDPSSLSEMGKQVIQGFWRGEHLVRREQQQSIERTCEGDRLGWANSNTNVVPSRLLNSFLGLRRHTWTDFHSHYFSLGPDGSNQERKTGSCSAPDIEDSAPWL
jgi:hypothetical protein